MNRRTFVRGSVGTVAASAVHTDRLRGALISKAGAISNPISHTETTGMLPLLPIDESARLGAELGIDRSLATSNIFRGLLQRPSAAAGVYGLLNALLFHNKVAARARELIILRIGWLTASEYVFCNHVQFARELGILDEEILGVRNPRRCRRYSRTDRALLRLADELNEHAQATPSTCAALEKAFAPDELVELLLTAGFWRMAAGFLKSARIPLDPGVPGWPEGREP